MKTVEVFTADITQPLVKERCYRFFPRLTDEERKKADRFLHEDDRLRSVAGRLMINTIAAGKLGTSAPVISLTEYGKPYIAGAEGFHFNLSHSGKYVVLAVSDAPVGIDIEQVIPTAWQDIAQTFGAAERGMLNSSADPLNCFYRIWTAREAFAKEEGIGLTLFDDSTPELDHARGIVEWHGRKLRLFTEEMNGHILSVCCPEGYEPSISEFRISE